MQRLKYGKYAGSTMNQVPKGYLNWCIKNEGKGPGKLLVGWCKVEVKRRKDLCIKRDESRKIIGKIEHNVIREAVESVAEIAFDSVIVDDCSFEQNVNWF